MTAHQWNEATPAFADLQCHRMTGGLLDGTERIISIASLEAIVMNHPWLPQDYISYLREVGWGTIGDRCYMIYGGPIDAEEIYGENTPQLGSNLAIFGDDYQGYCAGFVVDGDGTVVEIEPSLLELEATGLSFGEFIRQRIATCMP